MADNRDSHIDRQEDGFCHFDVPRFVTWALKSGKEAPPFTVSKKIFAAAFRPGQLPDSDFTGSLRPQHDAATLAP